MSTKIDVATFATVLAILAAPSVVSAQHGYANHGLLNSTEATINLSDADWNALPAGDHWQRCRHGPESYQTKWLWMTERHGRAYG